MTERERREGTGGTEDNVRDDLDEAAGGRRKEATPKTTEDEGSSGGGGVKDNVEDDFEKTQQD